MKFGIKGKLLILTGGMLVVFLCATIFAVFKVGELREQIDFLGQQRLPLTNTLGDIRSATMGAPRYTWVALETDEGSDLKKMGLERMEREANLLVESAEKYATFSLSAEGRTLIDQTIVSAKEVRHMVLEIKDLILLRTPAGHTAAEKIFLTEMPALANKLAKDLDSLNKRAAERNASSIAISQEKAKTAQVSLIILCCLTVLVSSIFGYLFSSNLSKQLLSITEQVGDASSQVSSASGQLSASSEELSNSAQGQAAAVEEASASLTEIQGMIEANVKNSEDSNKLTSEVYRYSEETKNLMNELSDAMTKILESNVKIEKLAKVIEEVGAKTEVIDDIVFKTQLLSFNASVEAERAGEHGRGFAVVAQEVGNLAQMSGKAANEISSIVKTSIKEADEIARENKERVENGGKLANVANKKMSEVMEKISHIQAATVKVLDASREQSQGINQITASVESINQSTQETASTSEEAASASEELSSQAEALLGLVNNMKTLVTGDSSHDMGQIPKAAIKKTGGNLINFTSKNKRAAQMVGVPAKKAVGAKVQISNADDAWEKI